MRQSSSNTNESGRIKKVTESFKSWAPFGHVSNGSTLRDLHARIWRSTLRSVGYSKWPLFYPMQEINTRKGD